MKTQGFSPELADYCNTVSQEFDLIPEDRVQSLEKIGDYIVQEPERRPSIHVL